VSELALYRSAAFNVFAVLPELRRDVLVVSFMYHRPRPVLAAAGFGQHYMWTAGLDAVHVIPADNHWYQHAEMPAVLRAVDAFRRARGYARLVTYGFSMGAYAAVNFCGVLEASDAVALMPQATLDPALLPGETRWRREAAALRYTQHHLRPEAPAATRCLVLYDPLYPLDAQHVRLISAVRRVEAVPLRFNLHRAPPVAVMQAALLGAAEGAPDVAATVGRLWRRQRAVLPQAWLHAARAQRLGSARQRRLLLRAAWRWWRATAVG
jgi:hypothetical protein